MKIFGYTSNDNAALQELSELSFQGDASEIRQLVRFLEHCASGIESAASQAEWEHEHIVDFCNDYAGPDVVVVRPE